MLPVLQPVWGSPVPRRCDASGRELRRERARVISRNVSPVNDFANSHDNSHPAGMCHRPTLRSSASGIAKGDLKLVGHVDALAVAGAA